MLTQTLTLPIILKFCLNLRILSVPLFVFSSTDLWDYMCLGSLWATLPFSFHIDFGWQVMTLPLTEWRIFEVLKGCENVQKWNVIMKVKAWRMTNFLIFLLKGFFKEVGCLNCWENSAVDYSADFQVKPNNLHFFTFLLSMLDHSNLDVEFYGRSKV